MRMQNLDPGQWKRMFELLDTALDLPVHARDAWLDALAEAHAGLKPALRELLEKHATQETDDFLTRLPEFTVAEGSAPTSGLHAPQAGSQIGPYRLLRELGRGGMGSVWLAERDDGTFKRSVALKLPHVSWSDALAQRFMRERDILASLEHPNIARLYEAGADEYGRPFLAMQYVEGQPIDQYCREKNLTIRECLTLILQVARAVAHAHARLVVHRDLKPGNILVSADGAVHLLDFGVAKLLEDDSVGDTRLTQFAGRAFTPDYAAPEQITGEPISTATDVYSLAVVSYELLTGTRPYRISRRSAAELARAIAEMDAPAASDATANSARKRELRGDLDAILNKAMKKQPVARYPTADAFASDLQRHLSHVPVFARPDSPVYRLRKFIARHRVPLSAGVVVAAALIGATVVSVWQARVAAEQRNRALTLLDRSEAVTDFVSLMLTDIATPDRPITIDELLERSESLVSRAVTENPEHQAVILHALASYYESFGNPAKAEPLLKRALSLTASAGDRGLRAKLTCQHAYAMSLNSDVEAATSTIMRELADPQVPPDAGAQCLRYRASIAQNTNDASGMLRYVWEAWRKLHQADRLDPLMEAGILGDIGFAYTRVGESDEAERYSAASLRKFVEIGRAEHPIANSVRNTRGIAYMGMGDSRQALGQFEEAIQVAHKRAAGGEAPSHLLYNRGLAFFELGRADEALAAYDAAIAAARRTGNATVVAFATIDRGRIAVARGDIELAQQYLDEVNAMLGKSVPRDGPNGTGAQLLGASISAARGDLDSAAATYSNLVEFWPSRGMAGAGQMAAALRGRADIYLRQGKADAAMKDAERALSIVRELQGGNPYSRLTGVTELLLSQIYAKQDQPERAQSAAREAFTHLSNALGPQSPQTRIARELMSVGPESLPSR
jgi:eukaryotic-like serine/threonine-protein kinase